MKLIEICEKEIKQVDYFGIELTVDAGVNFLAADDEGFVYGYFHKPIIYSTEGIWITKEKDHFYHYVAKVDIGDKDWKETLVEV
ncbi:hypothetical protein QE197_11930 [Arsenophonus nasoniae]|uniref:Uncharacterized protein n=1 Tax=Arsenophonus nasoniae TaxID=638 RepID=D2U0Z3_9GAMM|nr:hypothetical protein [Arsenophonus nasoniae]QBY44176.1 hypothetical protein ArsFIN_27530 [Arsenophonus nasoniae]WGM00916.1 hypothetical protein QE210_13825 [Arsenophonus nasoniae]WGM04475.1 hypothetical protein QE258_12660 [Arsenophonus nasoniae]WGM09581.1 hypothetical protein QE197_11930 [Arsenophonus nasoniae]WGM14302.1 hypothetical protein QE193_11825 [Arsenophonus nasoniae]